MKQLLCLIGLFFGAFCYALPEEHLSVRKGELSRTSISVGTRSNPVFCLSLRAFESGVTVSSIMFRLDKKPEVLKNMSRFSLADKDGKALARISIPDGIVEKDGDSFLVFKELGLSISKDEAVILTLLADADRDSNERGGFIFIMPSEGIEVVLPSGKIALAPLMSFRQEIVFNN